MLRAQEFSNEIQQYVLQRQLLARISPEESPTLQGVLERSAVLVVSSLTALAQQPDGQHTLWQTARQQADAIRSAAIAPEQGGKLSKALLGDQYHGGVYTIASATHAAAATVTEVLNLVTLVALGLLGQRAQEHRWDAAALSQWLQPGPSLAPGHSVPPTIPLGVPGMEAAAPAAARKRPKPLATVAGWLAVVVLTAVLSYLLGREAGRQELPRQLPSNVLASAERYALPTAADDRQSSWDATNPVTVATNTNFHAAGGYPTVNAASTSPSSGGGYVYGNAGVPVVLKFGDGTQQIIGANSTESRLYEFLANQKVQVDTINPLNGWIGFDRIYFESSKDVLSFESKWQLSNIARILNTFPAAQVRIGGYTDSSGNPRSNLLLSQDRAQSARATLIDLGVAADRLLATGYGSLDPIASNATPNGRALNRRVSIRVLKK